jgi:hypothetical protein
MTRANASLPTCEARMPNPMCVFIDNSPEGK